MDIATHRAEKGSRTIFNSKVDVFPKIGPKEMYCTSCYDELILGLTSYMPYRKAGEIINHLRWQDENELISSRTIAAAVVREGSEILGYVEAKAERILNGNHFEAATGQPEAVDSAQKDPEVQVIPAATVMQTINQYNEGREKERQIDQSQVHEVFEDPNLSVNISVDEVGVVEQKESGRCKDSPPKESRHYVKNTVIHIQQGFCKYILDGLGIQKMLIILAALLLYNDLLANRALIFFTDGAEDIKNAIKDVFGWRAYRIILDWYHLKKKCEERLSMAMKGREFRNEVLKELLARLWLGKVAEAIAYLRSLDDAKVRNVEQIEKLVAYFTKNSLYIPCYALRKKLGLRISSNRGEKANDLVVAHRQKHNGMSWSKPGSSGLANINALFLNGEVENWVIHRELNFKLTDASDRKIA